MKAMGEGLCGVEAAAAIVACALAAMAIAFVCPSVVVAAFTFTNSVYWGCAMLTISKGHLQG